MATSPNPMAEASASTSAVEIELSDGVTSENEDGSLRSSISNQTMMDLARERGASEAGGPHKTGYLLKRRRDGKWQRRWFETAGSFLTYYRSRKSDRMLAALSLPSVASVVRQENTDLGDDSDLDGGCVFAITLAAREYLLKATSVEEASEWVRILNDLREQGAPTKGGVAPPGQTPAKRNSRSSPGSGKAKWKKSERPVLPMPCC